MRQINEPREDLQGIAALTSGCPIHLHIVHSLSHMPPQMYLLGLIGIRRLCNMGNIFSMLCKKRSNVKWMIIYWMPENQEGNFDTKVLI